MEETIHELKTDPEVFEAVFEKKKGYEIRFDDRGYQVGDLLRLLETTYTGAEMKEGAPLKYTGRKVVHRITHILRGPVYGLMPGWVILNMNLNTGLRCGHSTK